MAAIAVNQAVGRLSDRLPDRRFLLVLTGAGGALGGLCFAVLRGYVAVLVTGAVFFSVGGVGFSQMFAYSKEFALARGRPVTVFTSVMRAVFSMAWVIGPPTALFVLTRYGLGPLYLVTGALSLAIAVLGRYGIRRLPTPPLPASAVGGERHLSAALRTLPGRMLLLLGAVIAFGVVNQMYGIDIALYVTRNLRLGAQFVGWMAGFGAALEILAMIAVGRIADRFGKLRVVLATAAGATMFFCLLPLARSVPALLALQVLNAAWTAVAVSIPMVMEQDEAPGGTGASSALYSSAFMSASLLAGAITGVTAAAIGYGNVFWVCAALSVAAGGMLVARGISRQATRGR